MIDAEEKKKFADLIVKEKWTRIDFFGVQPSEVLEDEEEVMIMLTGIEMAEISVRKGTFHKHYGSEYFVIDNAIASGVLAFKKLPTWTHICDLGSCYYVCSNCGRKSIVPVKICPECKSEMRCEE